MTLPQLNDRVVAIHPKTRKKVQVTVVKVLKNSFHGQDKSFVTTPGFTKWEPATTETKESNFVKSTPAKFKPGDRVRIVS
ncbi:MAG: hypothetical protein ACRCT1_07385, partial [Microcoleaceae cyanobacterium]